AAVCRAEDLWMPLVAMRRLQAIEDPGGDRARHPAQEIRPRAAGPGGKADGPGRAAILARPQPGEQVLVMAPGVELLRLPGIESEEVHRAAQAGLDRRPARGAVGALPQRFAVGSEEGGE